MSAFTLREATKINDFSQKGAEGNAKKRVIN